jgi:hypothetical protein
MSAILNYILDMNNNELETLETLETLEPEILNLQDTDNIEIDYNIGHA